MHSWVGLFGTWKERLAYLTARDSTGVPSGRMTACGRLAAVCPAPLLAATVKETFNSRP